MPQDHHRIYAVGDIHGRADLLDQLMDKIFHDALNASCSSSLVFVGDYIDRGSDSKGVIDRLLVPPTGFETYCLRGNHDQALLDFLEDPDTYPNWQRFGADATLMSYGVMPPLMDSEAYRNDVRDELAGVLSERHLQFYQNLLPYVEIDEYLFVHAGIRPGIALEDQTLEDMMWIRGEFLDSDENFGKVVVHGHTPTDRPVCKHNRIGIDTRAYDSNVLTAVVLDGIGARFLNT